MSEIDMSPRGITTGLRRVAQLRRLGLSLKKARIIHQNPGERAKRSERPEHQKQTK